MGLLQAMQNELYGEHDLLGYAYSVLGAPDTESKWTYSSGFLIISYDKIPNLNRVCTSHRSVDTEQKRSTSTPAPTRLLSECSARCLYCGPWGTIPEPACRRSSNVRFGFKLADSLFAMLQQLA